MSALNAAPVVDTTVPGANPSPRRQTLLLRGGLAFVFAYAAVSGVVEPSRFEHYVPTFVRDSVGPVFFLGCFAAYEILLALALLTRRYAHVASLLGALTLLSIVVLNLNEFDVLFRNIAIACGALVLADQTRAPRPARPAHGSSRRRRVRRTVDRPAATDEPAGATSGESIPPPPSPATTTSERGAPTAVSLTGNPA